MFQIKAIDLNENFMSYASSLYVEMSCLLLCCHEFKIISLKEWLMSFTVYHTNELKC